MAIPKHLDLNLKNLEKKIEIFLGNGTTDAVMMASKDDRVFTLYDFAATNFWLVEDVKKLFSENKQNIWILRLKEFLKYSFLQYAFRTKATTIVSDYHQNEIQTEVYLPKFDFDEEELVTFKNQKHSAFTMNIPSSEINIENPNDEIVVIDESILDDEYDPNHFDNALENNAEELEKMLNEINLAGEN